MNRGILVQERNGWKLLKNRDVASTPRGSSREIVNRNQHVVVKPAGHEVYFGSGAAGCKDAEYWFNLWSNT